MHLATYLGLLHHAEHTLGSAFDEVGSKHRDEPDVEHTCRMLSGQAFSHEERLTSIVERYGEERETEPERLKAAEFTGARSGAVGLLRDLQDLYSLASFVDITWTVVGQAAQGLRDRDLLDTVSSCQAQVATQLAWLQTRIKQAAPQALIAAR